MKKEINSKNAPKAVGPYSQAIQVGDMLFCSGQIGIDPVTNEMVISDASDQAKQVFKNLKAVLNEAGFTFSDVVKVTVFLKNMSDYLEVNEVYAGVFEKPYPARAAIEVSNLPKDALVEIECIAVRKSK